MKTIRAAFADLLLEIARLRAEVERLERLDAANDFVADSLERERDEALEAARFARQAMQDLADGIVQVTGYSGLQDGDSLINYIAALAIGKQEALAQVAVLLQEEGKA